MNKFKIMFKISLGSILKFFSILCLRLRAMHFSPLHKPTANLPGWMEIGVRFHALCTVCHMGSGPWTMVTGQWGECWWREGKWQISSVCNFIMGALRWSCLTESISTRLLSISFPGYICSHDIIHYPGKRSTAQLAEWLPRCECCFSCPLSVQSSDSQPLLKLG